MLNALKSRGIERVGQVLAMDPDDLLSIRNFGPQSLTDLRAKLQEHGFMPDLSEGSEDGGDAGEADTLSLLQDITPEASTFVYGEGELIDDEPEDEE